VKHDPTDLKTLTAYYFHCY